MSPKASGKRTVSIDGKSFTVKPNIKAYRGKKPIGQETGMHLFGFIRKMLENNEEWKVTDAHLVDLVMQEFAGFPEVLDSIQGNVKRSNKIPKYRSLYNTGCLGVLPTVVSFAYTEQGKPIRFPNKLLTKADCAEVARHYRIPDKRFLSEPELSNIRRENLLSDAKSVSAKRKKARDIDSAGRKNPRRKG